MEDYNFELGWGFYLIILPLIAILMIELIIRPTIEKLREYVYKFKAKVRSDNSKIERLKKWLKS